MADKDLEARLKAVEDRHKDHHAKLEQLTSPGAEGRGKKLAGFEMAIHDLAQRVEALEDAERKRAQQA